MQNLLDKINNYTKDGSPSVSELIELQEIARALKISRTQLDKLIKEAVSSQENLDNSTIKEQNDGGFSYERPDFNYRRDSFDREMNSRKDSEDVSDEIEKINKETEELEKTTKELLDSTLENAKRESEEQARNLEKIKAEAIENHQRLIEVETRKFNQEQKERLEKENLASENESFKSLKSTMKNSNKEFDVKNDSSSEVEELDDIIRKDNLEQRKKVEELVKKRGNSTKKQKTPDNKSTQTRSFSRDSSTVEKVKITDSTKIALILSIVALVFSLLFGFLGAIIGFFGLRKSNEGLRNIKISQRSFAAGSLSKLKSSKIMSIIAIVIGVFKFLRLFFWGFYYF